MRSLETEKTVVGTLLTQPNLYFDAVDIINQDAFTDTSCRAIYQSIEDILDNGNEVTIYTVEDKCKKNGFNVDCVDFISKSESELSFVNHCLILKEKHLSRMQGELAVSLSSMSNDPKQDPLHTNDFLLDEAEKNASSTTLSKPKTNAELIASVTKKIDAASSSGGITGVRTGYGELDKIYGGRQKTDLIIKAGRPAMGKTSQALCEAKYMAFDEGKMVAFFSLEMGAEQLMQRLISVHTGIKLGNIRNGEMSDSDWSLYHEKVGDVSSDNLIIIDDVFSLTGIKTTAKKLKMRGSLDAVYIDYLQLIDHSVKGRSKENEISEISRSLKMLAKQLDVPVVALSQLSRAVESRGGDKKPMLSDLRDSGAIEQDADIVEFIYRPEYYFPDQDEYFNKAYVIIAKNRQGSCRDVEFIFNKECTRFENVEDVSGYSPAMRNISIDDEPF